jgi:hypothetical protein
MVIVFAILFPYEKIPFNIKKRVDKMNTLIVDAIMNVADAPTIATIAVTNNIGNIAMNAIS